MYELKFSVSNGSILTKWRGSTNNAGRLFLKIKLSNTPNSTTIKEAGKNFNFFKGDLSHSMSIRIEMIPMMSEPGTTKLMATISSEKVFSPSL